MRDDCLSDDQLRRILVCGDSREALDRHAEGCGFCKERLAQFTTERPPLTTSMTGAWSDTPDPDGEGQATDTGATPAGPEFPPIPGYTVLRVVGQGGMAVVYEAREHELRRTVALKVIRPGHSSA